MIVMTLCLVSALFFVGCQSFFPPQATTEEKVCLASQGLLTIQHAIPVLQDSDLQVAREDLVAAVQGFVGHCRDKGLVP